MNGALIGITDIDELLKLTPHEFVLIQKGVGLRRVQQVADLMDALSSTPILTGLADNDSQQTALENRNNLIKDLQETAEHIGDKDYETKQEQQADKIALFARIMNE